MLVFRDGRETVSGTERLRELIALLRRLRTDFDHSDHSELLLDALLRAGELECALADARSPAARQVAAMTDTLASRLTGLPVAPLPLETLERLEVPQQLRISTPEGFAYYALHPLNYADLAAQLENGRTAVIGIRSIGTTLSAVCTAALRREGVPASRITVRPTGHPFDRKLEFDAAQAAWVRLELYAASEFWVVDEGPGLSGSSFLSVAEALENLGVPASRIRLLCGAQPRPDAMVASNAAARWARFRHHCVAHPWRKPPDASEDISWGKWRSYFGVTSVPGSWTQFERIKAVSEGDARLFKFEGFGRFGRAVADRAQQVAEAGFGPEPRAESDGFLSYPLLRGKTACELAVDAETIERLAAYCAFRASAFPADVRDHAALEHMMAWNYFEEFGEELEPSQLTLPLVRPVIVDGRMQPHEWIAADRLLKTDAASHGVDHFFPGPTDIAWDLAGTIIEWDLGRNQASHFTERYNALSGDDVQQRLPAYLLAYTMFRLGYCKMAADAMRGSDEESRLRRDYERYRTLALGMRNRAAAA